MLLYDIIIHLFFSVKILNFGCFSRLLFTIFVNNLYYNKFCKPYKGFKIYDSGDKDVKKQCNGNCG